MKSIGSPKALLVFGNSFSLSTCAQSQSKNPEVVPHSVLGSGPGIERVLVTGSALDSEWDGIVPRAREGVWRSFHNASMKQLSLSTCAQSQS